MIQGNIYGDRYNLKWLPEETPLFLGIWAKGGIELGQSEMLFSRPKVETFMCNTCHKFIINN